jgi:hypothetical protein
MPSTVIRSYRYDRRRRALEIVFQSRRRYTYLGVPEQTYDAMKAAFSKGEFFNRHIRDRFMFERNGEQASAGLSRHMV